MSEDLNELIGCMRDLRVRITLIRVLLEITRIMLSGSSPENRENPKKNRVAQRITKNNRARKPPKSRKKSESSARINEESAEDGRNKKKRTKNGQYVLNVVHP